MIRVTISMQGLRPEGTNVEINSESPYGPPDEPLLNYVVDVAVKQALAALKAQS